MISVLSGGVEFVTIPLFVSAIEIRCTELADLEAKTCWVDIPVAVDKSGAEDLEKTNVSTWVLKVKRSTA